MSSSKTMHRTTPPLNSTPDYNSNPIPPNGFPYPSKNNVYDGLIMSSGIILSSFLVRKIMKDMAPNFTLKNSSSLMLVVILSDYIVDVGKRYGYVPSFV